MRKYNIFQAIYMSFYSRDLYRDVARNWGGHVFLYLLFLLLLCWASMMVIYQPILNFGFRSMAEKIGPQIPPMTIKDGVVTTPENRPYFIKDPDKAETMAIIDTSGSYNNMDNVPDTTFFLMTKDTTYYRDQKGALRINKISPTLTLNVSPEKIQEVTKKYVSWLWVIILPFMVMMSFIYRIIQALFYGLIGKVFSIMSNIALTYGQTIKISIIAVTPAIILSTIFDWFNIDFHFEWIVFFAIAMIYLIFGIRSNKV